MARTVEDILRDQLGHLSIQLAIEISQKEKALEEVARLNALQADQKEPGNADNISADRAASKSHAPKSAS